MGTGTNQNKHKSAKNIDMKKNAKAKNNKLKTSTPLLVEYLVNIHINIVDKDGNNKPQSIDKKFDSTDILNNRREAIQYYLYQLDFFLNTSQINFSSPASARLKNYKDYKSFSIALQISDNQENCFDIDEPDSIFEFLSYEYDVLQNYQNIDSILIEDNWGNRIKVLKEDYYFFENLFDQSVIKTMTIK